jgi:hypothetical protein
MRLAEHDLITSGSLRFRSEKIRYPPSADLSDEEQAIANHEPVVMTRPIAPFELTVDFISSPSG